MSRKAHIPQVHVRFVNSVSYLRPRFHFYLYTCILTYMGVRDFESYALNK
jgi:hypothetical protein